KGDVGSATLKQCAAGKDNLFVRLRAAGRVSCVTAANINNCNRVTVSSGKRGEQCPMSGIEYQVSGIWPWTDGSNRSALNVCRALQFLPSTTEMVLSSWFAM